MDVASLLTQAGSHIRICRLCGEPKRLEEFSVRGSNGRQRTECKACVVEKVRQWRLENPESYRKQSQRAHAYVRNDPERWERERQRENARRRGKTNRGLSFEATCERCDEHFEYVFITRRRTVCDVCRRHDSEWQKYGLTGPEVQALRASGKCQICGTTDPGGRGEFALDHIHGTKIIRGVLCCGCNTTLGLMGEDPARLRAAADYLEE